MLARTLCPATMRIAAIAAAVCLAATADAARTGIVAAPGAVARAAGAAGPPAMTLTFAATMHIAGGYGHDGDGCVAAETALEATPTISRIWFDAANERLAQTNPDLERPDPRPNTTFVGLFEDTPPTAIAVTDNGAGHVQCETEPLPKGFCPNGTRACPPDFGTWGTVLTPFAAVLGTFYPNTTLLSETADADLWQYTSVTNTKMPNGTYIDVTRNYTCVREHRTASSPASGLRSSTS